MKKNYLIYFLIFGLHLQFSSLSAQQPPASNFARFSTPEFLTFDELVELSKNPIPKKGAVYRKLQKLWTTPIISNEAYHQGIHAPARKSPKLGRFLRVGTWNIEKSFNVDRAAALISDRNSFMSMLNPVEAPPSSEKYQEVLRQRDLLAEADILILQEMDIGVKRSNYVNAPKTLADALGMNYAYGATYLEIDPVYLGTESLELEEGGVDQEAIDYYRADPAKYKGMFGVAVLSRYPIKSVVMFPLKNQGYDWYEGEKSMITFLEKARRGGAKTVFLSELHREMKVGGRNFMRVDLHVPGLPKDTLTIINIHLEIKCLPKARQAQIEEILDYIEDINNPVIMAGDFNSAPTDLSPTSIPRTVKRQLKNPTNWFSFGVSQVLPQALLVNATRTVSNVTKNFQNPTARHIPIIAPNYQAGMFQALREFRFKDGHAFDFRGDAARSTNGESGLLANSNQKDLVGYKTTFQVRRPLGPIIGKYRLDWIFVKSFLKDPMDETEPYQFAPHFGMTLEEMNTSLNVQISDHHPNIADLPFEEPKPSL